MNDVTTTTMASSAPSAPINLTPPPPSGPPAPVKVTIPAVTTMAVRLVDTIDSERSQPGQTFHATLDSPLAVEGDVAVPAGYDVEGHIVDVKSAGKFAGQSLLALQLDRIAVNGKYYNIQTDQYRRQGTSRGKNTAEKVGAGAGIGAIIGAIAGGGKGAAIGAAAGGGLGGGVQAATHGQQIKLPTETVLNFTLQGPLTVVATSQTPPAPTTTPRRNNDSRIASASAVAGVSCSFFTSSTPIINPRPRTSPMMEFCFCSPRNFDIAYLPVSVARAQRFSFSMNSILASTAAQDFGLPPKVGSGSPDSTAAVISGRVVNALSGNPSAMPLAVTRISGSTP